MLPEHGNDHAAGRIWSVVDLFSGAGGASYGFHANGKFRIAGAADAEIGKPSTGHGAIDCNATYQANLGVAPIATDLGSTDPAELGRMMGVAPGIDVLIACPPCTGFSRLVANNHLRDDPRNSLVARVAEYASYFQPRIIFMENARELLRGRFSHHFGRLRESLESMGYGVRGDVHMLTRFGLPQQRERSVVLAARDGAPLPGLDDLWRGLMVDEKATHVRRAIWDLPPIESGRALDADPAHTSTRSEGHMLDRIRAIPKNGGSWADLLGDEDKEKYLIPAMWRAVEAGTLNHFCDVYGRMAWDRPAPTIKRECSHVGNGRYAHPEQDRLCTVREMAILQGFPRDYQFPMASRKNAYRNIGDAVPPLISFQAARLVEWMLTGTRPEDPDLTLPGTHLQASDIVPADLGQLLLEQALFGGSRSGGKLLDVSGLDAPRAVHTAMTHAEPDPDLLNARVEQDAEDPRPVRVVDARPVALLRALLGEHRGPDLREPVQDHGDRRLDQVIAHSAVAQAERAQYQDPVIAGHVRGHVGADCRRALGRVGALADPPGLHQLLDLDRPRADAACGLGLQRPACPLDLQVPRRGAPARVEFSGPAGCLGAALHHVLEGLLVQWLLVNGVMQQQRIGERFCEGVIDQVAVKAHDV